MIRDGRVLRYGGWLLLALGLAVPLVLLASDRRTAGLALNTLWLAGGTCLVALPLGTLVAVLLVRTDAPGRRWWLSLLAVMLFMPLYLQAAAWDAGFGKQGWYTLQSGSLAVPPLSGWRAAIWIHAMASLPWVVLIVGLGLRLVEPELEEAALLDGSAAQVLRRLTLRRGLLPIGVAALWVLVTTAGEMTVTDMYLVRTYAEELYTGFALGEGLPEAGRGVLPGIILLASLILAALVAVASLTRDSAADTLRAPWKFRLGAWRFPASLAVGGWLLAVMGMPLGSLFFKAGVEVRQVGGERLRSWSWEKFARILSATPGKFQHELVWSLAIAAAAATLAVLIAAWLAWQARRGGVRAWPALITVAVCLAIPGPLVGLALIHLLNQDWQVLIWLYDRTIFAPVVAVTIRGLPLATLVCWYALRTVSAETLASAATEGAGPTARFWWIAVPQRTEAWLAAWFVAFAVALGDLAASILVVPPGITTVSIRIFGLVHAGVDDQLAGLCLMMSACSMLVAAAALWLLGRSRSGFPA